MNEITQKRNDYYASLGTPPGPATSKGIYGEAEVTGHYASGINGVLGNYSI